MKLKFIFAAAMMFLGTQVSAAELDNVGTGDGSLMLTAFDFDNELSYVFNTGLNYSDIAAGATLSTTLDSSFTSLFSSNPSGVQWNLFAGTSFGAGAFGSFVGTAGSDQSVTSNNQGIASANGNASTFISQVNNQFDGSVFSGCANGGADFCTSTSLADPFNAGSDLPPAWNDNYGGAFAWDNSGSLGETLGLFLFETGTESGPFGDIAQPATPAVITQLGIGGLDLLASLSANGELNIQAVPIPAAVWLMGAGLVGLFGVSRRRVTA